MCGLGKPDAGEMDPVPMRVGRLRAEIAELGAAIRQLRQAGMDSATAQLLLSRKRAELDGLLRGITAP
jgi:hypothetical protein